MIIEDFIKENKVASYRLKQYNHAVYQDYIFSFDELTTWPKGLREKLKKNLSLSSIKPIKETASSDSKTVKVLFERISGGKKFEAVLMRHRDKRNTVCVSCMIGCPVGCVFCATGKMGFGGNLSYIEIVDQVLYFARILKKEKESVTNIVFMGMGEPLINIDQVMMSINIFTDPGKMGMSMRRITISTSGVTNSLHKLIEGGFKGRLALSLHAADQKLREQLIPIAERFPLPVLISVLSEYAKLTNKRISYEYILIDGVNDSPEQAVLLAKLIGNVLTHVNLIPYNPVQSVPLERSKPAAIRKFCETLTDFGIQHTLRITMGDDIKAACGQLGS